MSTLNPTAVCDEEAYFMQINLLGTSDMCIESLIVNGEEMPVLPQRLGDDQYASPNPGAFGVVYKRFYDLSTNNTVPVSQLPIGFDIISRRDSLSCGQEDSIFMSEFRTLSNR